MQKLQTVQCFFLSNWLTLLCTFRNSKKNIKVMNDYLLSEKGIHNFSKDYGTFKSIKYYYPCSVIKIDVIIIIVDYNSVEITISDYNAHEIITHIIIIIIMLLLIIHFIVY